MIIPVLIHRLKITRSSALIITHHSFKDRITTNDRFFGVFFKSNRKRWIFSLNLKSLSFKLTLAYIRYCNSDDVKLTVTKETVVVKLLLFCCCGCMQID